MAVIGQTEDGKRRWVFAQSVRGRFQKFHRWSGWVLLAILIGVPWIRIGGMPALRLDLPGRRLFALGAMFTPQDAIFILLISLLLALGLFFMTSLYGRVWCGYACPQTVFLEELIRPIEKWLQGDRGARQALSKKRWSAEWWKKQLQAWTIYMVLAVALSLSLMGFFEDPRLLWTGAASTGAYGVTAFFAAVLFLDFAWFREQFCIYLCPYARLQGALTDDKTVQVMYKVSISEPRGTKRDRRLAGQPTDPTADSSYGLCIDCNKCVVVCPTGIDIRNGYQLECIGCARCIDACDSVMDKLGVGDGLIQYTSVAEEAGQKASAFRPRTAIYGGLLSVLMATFVVLMAGRHELDATLNRIPGSLYQVDEDGWVRNTFFLQITNNHPEDAAKATGPHTVALRLEGLENAEVVAPAITVSAEQTVRVPVAVRLPPEQATARTLPFELELQSDFDTVRVGGTFKSGHQEVE